MDGALDLEFAFKIVKLHNNQDYEQLSHYMADSVLNVEDSWFSESRYKDVCKAIASQLGEPIALSWVGELNRKDSTLHLWKATYSDTDDEVLWHIALDVNDNKVTEMAVHWPSNR